jgi:hypothetical protein
VGRVTRWEVTPEWEASDAEAGTYAWDTTDDGDLAELLEGEEFEGDVLELEGAFREALGEEYESASPDEIEDALVNVFESMTAAESFNFAKALGQIEKGAAQALADPAVSRFATAALPYAGAAVGTSFGGPAGTAIGSGLGGAAAKALAGARPPAARPIAPIAPLPTSPLAATGSAAAAKGLVLTQQPEVLRSLLALSLGEHGRKSVDGVPVGAVMNLLSTIFGQAAADADELSYMSEEASDYPLDGEEAYDTGFAAPSERADALYAALLDAENEDFAEAIGEW